MRVCYSILITLLGLCGCAADSRQTVVEQQLRAQEDRIRELDQQLADARQKLTDQDLELSALRDRPNGSSISLASNSKSFDTLEERVAWGRVTSVQIHELTCGVVPQADGSNVVQLILQPLDDNLDVVKVAGEIEVTATLKQSAHSKQAATGDADASMPDGETQRATDNVAQDLVTSLTIGLTESRDRWASGLVASGFYLTVPLPDEFVADKAGQTIELSAKIDLGGGRTYRDDHQLQF
ncbi:MAG: hypothetical protein Fues2KO_04010 [Fuerstiella sp.]